MVLASFVLTDNVYILETGNCAETAKYAMGLVSASTTAKAAKAVWRAHTVSMYVKMTTRTARVNARSACLLIAIVTLNAVLVVVASATILHFVKPVLTAYAKMTTTTARVHVISAQPRIAMIYV